MSVLQSETTRAASAGGTAVLPRPRSARSRAGALPLRVGTHVVALPTDPRDMRSSAVRWAYAVTDAVRLLPPGTAPRPGRAALIALVWALAAAADDHHAVTAVVGGDQAQDTQTAWLREHGWLEPAPRGPRDGWRLTAPTPST